MGAHADLDLVFGEFEGELAGLGDRAGRHRHAHRADVGDRLARDALDLVEAVEFGSGAAGDLDHVDVAGDAAPVVHALRRRGGDVVGDAHGAHLDAVVLQHLGGHVEVHIVAGIVAIEEQHALAAMHGLGGRAR